MRTAARAAARVTVRTAARTAATAVWTRLWVRWTRAAARAGTVTLGATMSSPEVAALKAAAEKAKSLKQIAAAVVEVVGRAEEARAEGVMLLM